MSQLFGKLAVVGQKQYAGGVAVQAAYRINPLRTFACHKVKNSLAVMLVFGGGNAVLRLVHYDVNLFLALENLAVETHLVCAEHLGSQFGDNLSVNGYHTLDDILVGLSAGADAGICYEAVEADALFAGCLRLARFWGIGLCTRLPAAGNGFAAFQLADHVLEISAGALYSGLFYRSFRASFESSLWSVGV